MEIEKTGRDFCPYCMSPVADGGACPVCGLTRGSYTPAPHHLPPGTVLRDRYLVGRVLGEGGFGITYIGCDLQLEVRVAVKEYFPTGRVSRNATTSLQVSRYVTAGADEYDRDLERFLQEARTMARLSKNPTIVTVHDYFQENGTAYIAMEYIDGTTLKDLARQRGGRMSAWELLHLMEPLFFALQGMHEAGLIHRDISPDNIMLEEGRVRLLDFGCARELEGDRTLTVSLKHGYAPVEQYQGKGQGPWTDVYSLACTMYFCLTGTKPPQAMDRLVDDELVLPRKLGVDLTEAQERALLRGMAVRPRRRWQSMAEFQAALYEGVEELRPVVVPVPAPVPEPVPAPVPEPEPEPEPAPASEDAAVRSALPTRRNAVIGGAAAAAVVVAVAAGAALTGGNVGDGGSDDAAEEETDAAEEVAIDQAAASYEIVDGVAYVTDGEENSLRAALADAEAGSVVVEQAIEITDGPLTVKKPLTLQAGIYTHCSITVGAGGELISDGGELNMTGLLRTCDGGTLTVTEKGSVCGELHEAYWFESWDDVTVAEGGSFNVRGDQVDATGAQETTSYFALDEEELFADAAEVATEDELREALSSGSVAAITVAADAAITLSRTLNQGKPLRILEGATVTAQDGTWCVDDAVLINHGTLQGTLETSTETEDERSQVRIINDGIIDAEWYIGSCTLINLAGGSCNFLCIWLDNETKVMNLGTLTYAVVDDEPYADWRGSCYFCNEGTIRVEGVEGTETEFRQWGGSLRNSTTGSIQLGAYAWFDVVACELINYGSVVLEESSSYFSVHAWMAMEALGTVDAGAGQFENGGVVSLADDSQLGTSDGSEGALVHVSWDTYESWASSTSELVSALSGSDELIAYDLDQALEWSGDLEISGHELRCSSLVITDGSLYVEDGALVTGNLDLGGGTIWVGEGGVVVADAETIANCSAIYLEDGGVLLVQAWRTSCTLSEVAISVGADSRLVVAQPLALEACTVSIEEDGHMSAESDLEADGATTIENDGNLGVSVEWSIEGTLSNRGTLGAGLEGYVSGTFVNDGEVDNSNATIYVSGTFENAGTVTVPEQVVAYDGGTVTGL